MRTPNKHMYRPHLQLGRRVDGDTYLWKSVGARTMIIGRDGVSQQDANGFYVHKGRNGYKWEWVSNFETWSRFKLRNGKQLYKMQYVSTSD